MKTNEQIFAEIKEQGFITEKQILLIKHRSNREQKNLLDGTRGIIGKRVTAEQGQKGLDWLRKQARRRKNNPFSKDEQDIIANARPGDFKFKGFENVGNYYRKFFTPIYKLKDFEYIVRDGEAEVLCL